MIKIYFVNDEKDEDFEPPVVGPLHWMPIGDWVDHVSEPYCPCKPAHDADSDEYTHNATDGRERYRANGWLLD